MGLSGYKWIDSKDEDADVPDSIVKELNSILNYKTSFRSLLKRPVPETGKHTCD